MTTFLKQHVFKQDGNAARVVCECGENMLHPVHVPEIKVIRGTATPNYTGSKPVKR